jgi:hypothetical protein
LIGSACGDSSAPDAQPGGTELTVLLPSGDSRRFPLASLATSIEYTIDCGSTELDGALARITEYDGGPKGLTAVWKGVLNPPSPSCELRLLARDDDGEVICVEREVLAEPSAELFIELPCYTFGCTNTPLPGSAPKFCLSTVGVILSAEVPATLERRVHRIEYVISELWDEGFLAEDPQTVERYRGELAAAGVREADFGDGLVPMVRWETALEDVPALRYLIELTALDSEDAEICSVETRSQIIADAVAQIEVAMPCFDTGESQP